MVSRETVRAKARYHINQAMEVATSETLGGPGLRVKPGDQAENDCKKHKARREIDVFHVRHRQPLQIVIHSIHTALIRRKRDNRIGVLHARRALER